MLQSLDCHLVHTVVANLGVIITLHKAVPADFRFPILTRLADLAEEFVPLLEIQMVANPPMSMIKIKDIYKKYSNVLDECPLIVKIFAACCKDFLTLIHSSDFCVPYSPKKTDTAFILGFGISSFEDRAGLMFKNLNRKIQEQIRTGEMKLAKTLSDHHKNQDDMMRALWNYIESTEAPWRGSKPTIPSPMKIYNECEPQVIGQRAENFSWYERPEKYIQEAVKTHFMPLVDEVPDLKNFPTMKQFVQSSLLPSNDVAKRLKFSKSVSVTDNISLPLVPTDDRKIEVETKLNCSDTSVNKSNILIENKQPSLIPTSMLPEVSIHQCLQMPVHSTPKRRGKSKTAQVILT